MDNQDFSKYKMLFIIMAAIVVLSEIRGAFDLKKLPYDGFWSSNNIITKVFPDSPAEKAGFKVGDVMKIDGGIDVKDTKALTQRRPWARVGETRTYVFKRNGEIVSLDLTFTNLPMKQIALYVAYALIGFCFLIFGLWAYFKVMSKSTTLLALIGISAGFALINEPYIETYILDRIFFTIQLFILLFGFAFLLHFMIVFPKSKAAIENRNIMRIIYSPAVNKSINSDPVR